MLLLACREVGIWAVAAECGSPSSYKHSAALQHWQAIKDRWVILILHATSHAIGAVSFFEYVYVHAPSSVKALMCSLVLVLAWASEGLRFVLCYFFTPHYLCSNPSCAC